MVDVERGLVGEELRLGEEVDLLRVALGEVWSAHDEKVDRLADFLALLRRELVKEIEYCRKPYFRGAYG